jgi:uncharacterized membrane protein YkvA (DUF1232 family)
MKKRKASSNPARPVKKVTARKPVRPMATEEKQAGGDEVTESAAFRRATAEAEAYAADPKRLRKLLRDAVGKLNVIPRGPFGEAWPYLLAMLRAARDFQTGDYRDMPRPKLLIVIAAIIYFVSPFDVIPDYLPVLGHIDDAFVVGLALKTVRAELDTFMAWETSRI